MVEDLLTSQPEKRLFKISIDYLEWHRLDIIWVGRRLVCI